MANKHRPRRFHSETNLYLTDDEFILTAEAVSFGSTNISMAYDTKGKRESPLFVINLTRSKSLKLADWIRRRCGKR